MGRSVDVVVPCYSYGKFLRQCVTSVLQQTGVNVRVLIIDDASPDDSAEVGEELARESDRITLVRHAKNRGVNRTMNEGIEWASKEYLLLLSADDFLLPGALDRSVNLMENTPEIGFTFGNAYVQLQNGLWEKVHPFRTPSSQGPVIGGLQFIQHSGARNIVTAPTAVTRTDLQKRLGGYCLELPHAGDMEMWHRFAAHASVGFVDAYQAVYRRHGENMSLIYTDSVLPDFYQRLAALEYFFATSARTLTDWNSLRQELLRQLGLDAIRHASAAFNEGRAEVTSKLMAFSLDVSPDVRSSWPWFKLAIKRAMGLTTWRAVRSYTGSGK